ncbi:MAG: AF1514 family protein [Desulfobacter sp.]|nr:MAG: AF1514 family protein [Desulfobacter sp.]
MAQIHHVTDNQSDEYITMNISTENLDFAAAKAAAKGKAFEFCDHPMILSWKNGITGESHPDYECGVNDRPFWIRYAQGRGANLTIDINNGDYVFMVLKI